MVTGGHASPPVRLRRAPTAARAIIVIAMMLASSCAALHGIGLWSAPGIGSFNGVSFGDGFRESQLRFPAAAVETSPYGAQSLRLNNVDNDGIGYRTVIYEFADKSGMQLVIAKFDPSRTDAVRHWIIDRVASVTPAHPAQASGVSTWTTLDGEIVILLTIIGPKGLRLRPDIKLRELNARSAL
jgi:hypothetical protein